MRRRDNHGQARAGQRRCRSARRPHRRAPAGARLRDALLLLLRQPHLGHLPPAAASAPAAEPRASARPARRRLAEARLNASGRGLAASPPDGGEGCADMPSQDGRQHNSVLEHFGLCRAHAGGARSAGAWRGAGAHRRAEDEVQADEHVPAGPESREHGRPQHPGVRHARRRQAWRAPPAGAAAPAGACPPRSGRPRGSRPRSCRARPERAWGQRRGGPRLPAGPGCPAGTPLS